MTNEQFTQFRGISSERGYLHGAPLRDAATTLSLHTASGIMGNFEPVFTNPILFNEAIEIGNRRLQNRLVDVRFPPHQRIDQMIGFIAGIPWERLTDSMGTTTQTLAQGVEGPEDQAQESMRIRILRELQSSVAESIILSLAALKMSPDEREHLNNNHNATLSPGFDSSFILTLPDTPLVNGDDQNNMIPSFIVMLSITLHDAMRAVAIEEGKLGLDLDQLQETDNSDYARMLGKANALYNHVSLYKRMEQAGTFTSNPSITDIGHCPAMQFTESIFQALGTLISTHWDTMANNVELQ